MVGSRSGTIAKNSVYNMATLLATLPLGLVLTWVTIAWLGAKGFGLWAVIGAFSSYVGLIDFGLSASLTKFTAGAHATQDYDRINELLNTSFVTQALLGLAAVLAVFITAEQIVRTVFHVEPGLAPQACVVLVGSVALFAANLAFGFPIALLKGVQRYDLSNLILIVSRVTNLIGVSIFLAFGLGLIGLLLASGLSTVTTIVLSLIVCKRAFPRLEIAVSLFRRRRLRELFGFSIQMQVVQLATVIHSNLDKILLAYFVGLEYVAYYAVASQIVVRVRGIVSSIVGPLLPAASDMEVSLASDFPRALYHRSFRYLGMISVPLWLSLFTMAFPFIELWLGEGYEWAALALQILALANLVNSFTAPGFLIQSGRGRPRYGMYGSIVGLVTNVVLGLILVVALGYIGTLAATATSLLIGSVLFLYLFHKVEMIPFDRSSWKVVSVPLGVGLLISTLIFGINAWQVVQPARVIVAIVEVLLFFASYGVILLLLGYADRGDVVLVERLLPHSLARSTAWQWLTIHARTID